MRREGMIIGLALAAVLAGCGADGPPIPPDTRERPAAGITISGQAQVGVAGGSAGTRSVTRIAN